MTEKTEPTVPPVATKKFEYPLVKELPLCDVWEQKPLDTRKWGEKRARGADIWWPGFSWDVLEKYANFEDEAVQLINMSFRTFTADFPTGRRERKTGLEIWETQTIKPWALLPALPIPEAIKYMRVGRSKDDPRHFGQLVLIPPRGDCGYKQRFADKEVGTAPFHTCCFSRCPRHQTDAYPAVGGDHPRPEGPEIVWSVFLAQHWARRRLTEEAIERFMDEVDNRPDVHAYLSRVVALRSRRKLERQGLEGGSRLLRTATH